MGRRWQGTLTIQGEQCSGSDRRIFDLFTWRDPPLTLRVQTEDFGAHQGAAPVGRIDTLELLEDGRRVWGTGEFSESEPGVLAAQWVDEGVLRGVSVDPGEYQYVEEIIDPDGNLVTMEEVYELYALADEALDDNDEDTYAEIMAKVDALSWRMRFTSYEIAAATLVATPGFKDARIELVAEDEEPVQAAAATPVAERLAALAAAPSSAAERLRALVGARAGSLLASAPSDGQRVAHFNPGRTIAAPAAVFAASRQASGPAKMKAEWYKPLPTPEDRSELAGLKWTITDDGRSMGYLYTWDACHRSFGQCQAPEHQTDFPEFHVGEVSLDDGTRMAVGSLTFADLHAGDGPPDAAVMQQLMEDTGRQLAPVRLYADRWGVQCCGQVYPDVEPALVARALAGFPSGDWRDVLNGDGWRLYGLHVVNTPGYPWRVDGERGSRMVASMRPTGGMPPAAPAASAASTSCGCGGHEGSSACACGSRTLSAKALADLTLLDVAMGRR